MGCFPKMSGGWDANSPAPASNPFPEPPNPNPSNFVIEKIAKTGRYYVVLVRYPDCTTFEGRKVLVTTFDPRGRKILDPHFTEHGGIVARFMPTEEGQRLALMFARSVP